MQEQFYLTEEQWDSLDIGYRSLQQVFADMEYGHSFSDLSEVIEKAMNNLGTPIYKTGIPESPEPNRDDPSNS